MNFSWTLAKGRGRSAVCPLLESRLHDEGNGDSDTMPLFLLDSPGTEEPGTRAFFRGDAGKLWLAQMGWRQRSLAGTDTRMMFGGR